MHKITHPNRFRHYTGGTKARQTGALRFDIHDAQSFGHRRKHESIHGLVEFCDVGTLPKQMHTVFQIHLDDATFDLLPQ